MPTSSSRQHNALKAFMEEPYQEYWSHLGRLIHTLSMVELRLMDLLKKYAKLTDYSASVFIQSGRIDTIKDQINKILDARNMTDVKNRLEKPLAQLKVIVGTRNNIAHWGAVYEETFDSYIVSNRKIKPAKQKIKEYILSNTDMKNMTDDLEKIHVALILEPRSSQTDAFWNKYFEEPWLYKHPQPFLLKKLRRRPPQLRERQPRASRKSRQSHPQ